MVADHLPWHTILIENEGLVCFQTFDNNDPDPLVTFHSHIWNFKTNRLLKKLKHVSRQFPKMILYIPAKKEMLCTKDDHFVSFPLTNPNDLRPVLFLSPYHRFFNMIDRVYLVCVSARGNSVRMYDMVNNVLTSEVKLNAIIIKMNFSHASDIISVLAEEKAPNSLKGHCWIFLTFDDSKQLQELCRMEVILRDSLPFFVKWSKGG